MAKCRVFTEPSGNVRVLHPNESLRNGGESDDDFINRIGSQAQSRDPSLAGLPFVDVDRADILALDRSQRHKWRVNPAGRLRVEPTVPDRPHPQQARLDAIAAATTVDELKNVLTQIVRGS